MGRGRRKKKTTGGKKVRGEGEREGEMDHNMEENQSIRSKGREEKGRKGGREGGREGGRDVRQSQGVPDSPGRRDHPNFRGVTAAAAAAAASARIESDLKRGRKGGREGGRERGRMIRGDNQKPDIRTPSLPPSLLSLPLPSFLTSYLPFLPSSSSASSSSSLTS